MRGVQRFYCSVTAVALVLSAPAGQGLARPLLPAATTATTPVELAELIILSLPTSDRAMPGWGYMAEAPVSWQHSGYDKDSQGNTVRVGLARVRVDGQVARKLGRQPVEIPWTVMLQGSPNPERGVISVHISPGSNEQPCVGNVRDCLFRADEVFGAATAQHRRLCFAGTDDAYQSVYAVAAPGRRPGFAVLTRSFGPDGGLFRVDVSWTGTPPDCKNPTE